MANLFASLFQHTDDPSSTTTTINPDPSMLEKEFMDLVGSIKFLD